MKRVVFIRFEAHEITRISGAIDGLVGSEDSREQPNVLRRFRNSANQGEPFSFSRLVEVHAALCELVEEFRPQTTVGWWREAGAPGADDAVEGLARERANQIDRLEAVARLVLDAGRSIDPYFLTRDKVPA